jgi:hypothetical protein
MVDRLDSGNDVHQSGIMVVDMFHELRLGVRRARDENSTGVGDRLGDSMEKILILSGVAAADGIRFVMDVPGRVMGMQHQVVDFRPPEMEHAGLMVIDPYDCVIMTAHSSLLSNVQTVPDGSRPHTYLLAYEIERRMRTTRFRGACS